MALRATGVVYTVSRQERAARAGHEQPPKAQGVWPSNAQAKGLAKRSNAGVPHWRETGPRARPPKGQAGTDQGLRISQISRTARASPTVYGGVTMALRS